ncbi:hypothetical protein B0H13DRAFT_2399714 [Mycena leptocephala]|nr:hypothetical protein B0H13DRAFT_2399714 [Mycena leptocephala]
MQAKQRAQRAIRRGVPPPEPASRDSESDHTPDAVDPADRVRDEHGYDDGENEGDDEGGLTASNKGSKTGAATDATYIQAYATKTLRRACGVMGKEWPDPDIVRINPTTGVKYLTPFFEYDVTDSRNHDLCLTVARLMDMEMKAKRPPGVSNAAVWDPETLLRCTKKSFRAMKKQWKRGHDDLVAKRAHVHERATRMYRRRCTKYAHIKSQIEAYAQKYSLPVSVVGELLHEQLLSDEASGPEDEDEEEPGAWKDVSSTALKKYAFLEVLENPWRSDELTEISHTMQSMYHDKLTTREIGNIKYTRVTDTSRTSPRIPLVTPWDFGISRTWLDEQRTDPKVSPLVVDWGTYGNPQGFGSQGAEGNETVAGGETVVDPRFDFDGLDGDANQED